MKKLSKLPSRIIDRLADDWGVAQGEVRDILTRIHEFDIEQAMDVANEIALLRSWNMQTRLAVFEGIDLARIQTDAVTYS